MCVCVCVQACALEHFSGRKAPAFIRLPMGWFRFYQLFGASMMWNLIQKSRGRKKVHQLKAERVVWGEAGIEKEV